MTRASSRHLAAWLIILGWSLIVALGIARLANPMAPIRDGNSAEFWRIACGVSPTGETEQSFGGVAYFVDDTWAAYDVTHMHGSDLFRVRLSSLALDFDSVCKLLMEPSGEDDKSDYVKGFNTWRAQDPDSRDIAALVESIKKVRLRRIIVADPDVVKYIVASEQQFWQRWERANWYWANIVFEWLFLSGLILFAFWPTVRDKGIWAQTIHIAVVPLMFFSPTYLGYATYSFTSAGPSGGVLYPFLLRILGIGQCNRLDLWILERTPRLLEPLSIPIGSPLALSGRGFPGPTTAVVIGVLMSCFYFGLRVGVRRWRSARASQITIEQCRATEHAIERS